MFLLFDSKVALTKVFIETCNLQWEELTLMEYASESAAKVFCRSLNYVSFYLNNFFSSYAIMLLILFRNKEKKLYHSMISSS